jgi:hypothetical protein
MFGAHLPKMPQIYAMRDFYAPQEKSKPYEFIEGASLINSSNWIVCKSRDIRKMCSLIMRSYMTPSTFRV